jgi:hypothetical protein
VAVYNDFTGADLDLTVQFKPISGKGDQGAGLVWRYRDPNNYFVSRCNALEDNCTIYHVVNGRRQAFLSRSVKVASKIWHTLKVEARGDQGWSQRPTYLKYQWPRATNPGPPTLLTEAKGLVLGVNSSSPLTPSFGTFAKKSSTPPTMRTPVSVVSALFR